MDKVYIVTGVWCNGIEEDSWVESIWKDEVQADFESDTLSEINKDPNVSYDVQVWEVK